ncbi:MAG: amino acid adenylation domain-containing protein, partial [Ferruginibacter sp.]|nr:amino acid adenylation domain-containing protein [Ferruginibacter sp.]
MNKKQFSKTLTGKTGKDLVSLMGAKGNRSLQEAALAPSGATEITLYNFYKNLLGHDGFGVNDDFFQVGGNSLKAIQLLSRISAHFLVHLSLTDIFLTPSIAQIALLVEEKQKENSSLPALIETKKRPEYIPLSFNQERLWYIHQLAGSTQYHIPAVLRLKGKLNKEALSFAFSQIINRHEPLRTAIREEAGIGYQLIQNPGAWQLSFNEGSTFASDPAGLQQYVQQLINAPFDLSKDYMLRAELIRLDEPEHFLVVTLHHIASDGWSTSIIIKELVQFYEAFEMGAVALPEPLPVQYADFSIWQRQHMQGVVFDKKLAYWKEKLDGTEALQLPTDYPRPAVQSFKGALEEFTIDKELADQLHLLSRQQGVSLFMILLAAFKVLLYRYTAQQDICVGTAIAGRQQQELEGLIGFFVNTLALRSHIDNNLSFNELLKQVKSTTLDAFENQDLPFEKLVEELVKDRDTSRSPLFQVMFVLQNTPGKQAIHLGEVILSEESFETSDAKFELDISLTETEQGIQGSVEYFADLYQPQTIGRMMEHYKELLISIVKDPGQKIGLLTMLTGAEEYRLRVEYNDTHKDYPNEKTVIDLFEEQVEKTPGSIALIFEDVQVSYRELNERSNQLAHYLSTKGVKAGELVPVCIGHCIEMVIGILGILKAGGAYVPIDTDYPAERIRYILEDTGAKMLVTNNDFAASFESSENSNINEEGDATAWSGSRNPELVEGWRGAGGEVINVDQYTPSNQPSTNPTRHFAPDQLACIIYTSGSSGKPKGVQLGNAGIVNRLQWMWATYPFEPGERNAIKTSIGFVDHIWELFGALNRGVVSVIFPKETLLDLDILIEKLSVEKITRWVLVPSLLRTLLNKLSEEGLLLPHLKYWTSSGETLPVELVADFYTIFPSASHKLINIYGSSEVTADATCYDTSADDKILWDKLRQHIPIGKPISNTRVYLIDKNDQWVAQGVAGEICITGVQVAQGYLNLPELTAERFTTDPFSKIPGSRMFRTGDIGRWLNDGNIDYLGRIDDQVKIRGNRVELGEIEFVLNQLAGIKQSVVLAKTDNSSNNILVGYVVGEANIDKQALTESLQDKLPGYMVPFVWVQVEELPLTPSGKIDKKALPDPGASDLVRNEYTAPGTELEKRLALTWQQLLRKERVGIHDNFFEIGGHSLLAMRLVSTIRKDLAAELTIKDLFSYSTIALLAARLQQQNKGLLLPPIEAKPRPQHIPLSFSQERLWFIDQLEGTVQYHLPTVLRLTGILNTKALNDALQTVVNRHESLRSVIIEEQGKAYQQVRDAAEWELQLIDASAYKNDREGLQLYVHQIISKAFDLSKDFMLRAALFTLEDGEHLLVVTLHHIAADGWSLPIIVKEVAALYGSFAEERPSELLPLQIQYADYAIWQRNYLQGTVLDNKIGYWKDKLYAVAPLQLPTDFARPVTQSTRGASVNFSIDKELSGQVQLLCQQVNATLFMTLLATFKILLHRYSGQQDICVGTPIAGRQQQEVEELIGFFVNTLAIRTQVDDEVSFTRFLAEVKHTTLEAYDHQDAPFEKVVELVVKERDMGRSPLFQVMFVLQNRPDSRDLIVPELNLSAEILENNTSKFDISFYITETDNALRGSVEYCTDLYKEQTIIRMIAHYKDLLASVVKKPQQKIGLLPMLGRAEESQLLEAFNDNKLVYPAGKTIIDLFEEQVAKTPAGSALVLAEGQLSYQQLNSKANQLAHFLRSKGVQEESLVPICMERSPEMVIGILGILKAGAAYVPIDPGYPAERISYMLEDSGAGMIISSKESSGKIPGGIAADIIEIDSDWFITNPHPAENLSILIGPSHLAYVIYTSGSTGKPKGVMLEHRNLYSFICWCRHEFSSSHFDIVYATTSICFDLSVFELFFPLTIGKPIRIIENGLYIGKYLPGDKNVLTNTVPVVIQHLLQEGTDLSNISVMNMAGEPIPSYVQQGLDTENTEVRNLYGPTEDTTYSTVFHLIKNQRVFIGKPVANTSIQIVNKMGKLVPIGVPGEIYLGGDGLARGYLNRLELTAEKFIKDPYSKEPGAKLYKTGDLGRWLQDGNIEYLGRLDEQVKIRGFRVELGEIETVLEQCELVEKAVVLAKDDQQFNKLLVAYIVPRGLFDRDGIINHLNAKLPAYMVPSFWMEMENLPLTPNGKINRKALPDPATSGLTVNNYVAPGNEIEKALAEIWQDLLQVEQVGIHDNFFELGGHSLRAMQVVSSIRKELEIELSVKDLFSHSTIASLAALLQKQHKGLLLPSIETQQKRDRLPLSFSQERLWFIDQLEGSVQYHSPAILRLKGNLDTDALAHSIKMVIGRHDILRTVFREQDGQVFQSIKEKADW